MAYTLLIDNVPVDNAAVQKIVIELRENMHDLAIIEFAGVPPRYITDYVDKPLTVSISAFSNYVQEFYGYINYMDATSTTHDGTVNGSPFQLVSAVCFGASYLMKSRKTRAWSNYTLKDLVKELADEYRFTYSVPNSQYVFPRVAQNSQTDWQVLVSSANRLGYNVSVHGTHIHVWDPSKAPARNISYAVLQNLLGSQGATSVTPGQIIRFDPRIGGMTPFGSRVPDTLHYVDQQGVLSKIDGSSLLAQGSLGTSVETLFTDQLNVSVDSQEMGEQVLHGLANKKYPYVAFVHTVGIPGMLPGGIVKIDKYNTKFDGYWYVRSVRHEMVTNNLQTYMEIVKDSTDETLPTFPKSAPYVPLKNTTFIKNKWVASTEYAEVYS
jgi:hypothetical protein